MSWTFRIALHSFPHSSLITISLSLFPCNITILGKKKLFFLCTFIILERENIFFVFSTLWQCVHYFLSPKYSISFFYITLNISLYFLLSLWGCLSPMLAKGASFSSKFSDISEFLNFTGGSLSLPNSFLKYTQSGISGVICPVSIILSSSHLKYFLWGFSLLINTCKNISEWRGPLWLTCYDSIAKQVLPPTTTLLSICCTVCGSWKGLMLWALSFPLFYHPFSPFLFGSLYSLYLLYCLYSGLTHTSSRSHALNWS